MTWRRRVFRLAMGAWLPRYPVLMIAAVIGTVAVGQTTRAARGLESGGVSIPVIGRNLVGPPTWLEEIPALPVFVSGLVLLAVLLIWVVRMLIRPAGPLWWVVGVPVGAVALDRALVVVLLASDPEVSLWSVAGGFFNAGCALALVGVFSLITFAGQSRPAQSQAAPCPPACSSPIAG
ncbi:hypothetical protein NQ156_08025 [Microbacterium sp. zg.Y625]|uniref:hypothetical protein n=1 Tax=Microbacterium jiangjiandongii TaxID=3049071 RepID=UPI00214C39B5|nr:MULTISPECIES: hypothetical protein [unclassified Microbacterium]MCR2793004.1 hypothetical protein [Microbacterium sp. zg.Y625]WIM24119.1 hypothetical protein QNO14_08050 [Microbacterium sp. zg-Y625]